MDTVYDRSYFQNYSLGDGLTVDYKSCGQLRRFFKEVARKLVEDYHPAAVLDAGCATGLLVQELRELGVEAYGIDISEYAISEADNSVRPFCAVCPAQASLPENFPRRYDLITCIEVLEHLRPDDGALAIQNLCTHTDRLIFSSTSTDLEEPTHINVNTMDHWASEFAKHGFFDRVDRRPAYISPDACCFEKGNAADAVSRYEKKCIELRREQAESADANRNLEDRLRTAAASREAAERENAELKRKLGRLEENYQTVSASYNEILSSRGWRMTAPVRRVMGALRRFFFKFRFTRLLWKGLRYLLQNGFRATFERCRRRTGLSLRIDYSKITRRRRKREKNTVFDRDVKFSILVPLYNTPLKFLEEMLRSVQNQTYQNWELCLADGSGPDFARARSVCEAYAAADRRIKYKKLSENLGISGNTNACIEMAAGDYIALLDHDDVLQPSALFEVMKAICRHDADFIYTDEATFSKKPSDAYCPNFKPDFSPDTLRSYNYICHLTVFSRELLEKVGKFRSEFDGSQDYDMILRLTEKAKCIVHIPQILYFWRGHAGSVASDIGAKPYVLEAAHRALQEHLKRCGMEGTVEDARVPSAYRLKYRLRGTPKVSVIIPNMDNCELLRRCVSSICGRSTYGNFELIIVENNSKEEKTFACYRELAAENPNIRVVTWDGKFNYPAINNFGFRYAAGEYVLFLNNDTEVITPGWIEELLMFVQRPDVGAAGAMLYYPDDTVQHAGVILGIGGVAGHAHKHLKRGEAGYMSRAAIAQNLSAVTAACVMLPRGVFEQVGGFDERFGVAFNDVDLCMRIRKTGHLIVFTPFAELYHYESKTRGLEDSPEKIRRFNAEAELFRELWGKELERGDPYYNPNLSLDFEDFRLRAGRAPRTACGVMKRE